MKLIAQLKAAQHLARIGSWDWEVETNAVTWSEELSSIFGRDPNLPPPDFQEHSAIYTPESWERLEQAVQHTMQTGQPYELELQIRRPDGSLRWVIACGEAIRNDAGHCLRLYGTVQDVTERKLAEEQRRISQEAADQDRRVQQGQYLVGIGHDIRTPMHSIMGLTELAMQTRLDQEQREYLQGIKTAGEALLHLLEDLLDFSQLQSGGLVLESKPLGLRKELGELIRLLAPQAHQKQLEMFCEIAPNVPNDLVGDAARLRQILHTLLLTSIGHREQGEVHLAVQKESDREEGVVLHFLIRDTGHSLPPPHPELGFSAAGSGSHSAPSTYAGTDLGMRVSAGLAEIMHGRLWVDKDLDEVRTFHFLADFGLAPQPAPTAPAPSPLPGPEGIKALVVEDHPASQRIVGDLLAKMGLQPLAAENEEKALIMLRRAAIKGHPIPLVLLDGNLPGRNTLELVKKMRMELFPEQHLVLMLKPETEEQELVRRCLQAGVSECLHKPILEENLQPIIRKFMAENTLVGAAHNRQHSAAPAPGCQGLRILVVEDNPVNQVVLIRMLQKMGHRAEAVANGQESLLRLEKEHFDLVLMDIQMPVMDGWEATAAIRAREVGTGKHIPIVAVTAHSLPQDRAQSFASGMDEFLVKPVMSDNLIRAIGVVMRKDNNI